MLIGPAVIRLLTSLKIRQTICEDAPEGHKAKQGTPTMGGLIIFAGILAGSIVGVAIDWHGGSVTSANWNPAMIWAIAFLALSNMGLGFLDDYLIVVRGKNLGLKARQKLLGQFVTATAFVAFAAHAIPSGFTSVLVGPTVLFHLGWAYYPLAVLLIVSMSNAVNLTDGLDGLVGGLVALVGFPIGILVFAIGGHIDLCSVSWAIAGGCAGFLWHNSYPAKVFMGDTGSLGIGAALGGIAIASKQEILILILCAVFVFEALSVSLQVISFKTTGRRIFKMSPIHHHFELCGWPEQKIVVRFWIVEVLIAFAVFAWILK